MNEPAQPQRLKCETCHTVANFPSKSRARKNGWLKDDGKCYCPTCAVDARDAMRERAEARQAEKAAKEYERWEREIDERQAWPGNRRIARWVEGRLKKAGVRFERNDTLGGSIYFELYDSNDDYCGTFRIADHRSPAGGGFNVEKQARSGEADIDCNPHSDVDWKAAVVAAIELGEG